mgnify:CR=1 FL=1
MVSCDLLQKSNYLLYFAADLRCGGTATLWQSASGAHENWDGDLGSIAMLHSSKLVLRFYRVHIGSNYRLPIILPTHTVFVL